MSTITVRNIDSELKRRLRMRAAASGRSMEEEVRSILRAELARTEDESGNLYERIRRHIDPVGGIDLVLPEREPMREPPVLLP